MTSEAEASAQPPAEADDSPDLQTVARTLAYHQTEHPEDSVMDAPALLPSDAVAHMESDTSQATLPPPVPLSLSQDWERIPPPAIMPQSPPVTRLSHGPYYSGSVVSVDAGSPRGYTSGFQGTVQRRTAPTLIRATYSAERAIAFDRHRSAAYRPAAYDWPPVATSSGPPVNPPPWLASYPRGRTPRREILHGDARALSPPVTGRRSHSYGGRPSVPEIKVVHLQGPAAFTSSTFLPPPNAGVRSRRSMSWHPDSFPPTPNVASPVVVRRQSDFPLESSYMSYGSDIVRYGHQLPSPIRPLSTFRTVVESPRSVEWSVMADQPAMRRKSEPDPHRHYAPGDPEAYSPYLRRDPGNVPLHSGWSPTPSSPVSSPQPRPLSQFRTVPIPVRSEWPRPSYIQPTFSSPRTAIY